MKSNALTIAKKELARFFSNKASAAIAILLPGILLIVMWSLMGNVLNDMFESDEDQAAKVAVVNLPAGVESFSDALGINFIPIDHVPDADELRADIKETDYAAVAVFPENFEEDVLAYDPASGQTAPQVEIYYDGSDVDSLSSYSLVMSLLDGYESALANKFDVNMGEAEYDVAESGEMDSYFTSFIPFLLLILLFSSCMALAAEAISGEKERGTMATMLATPIKRSDIALGKILALTLIGLMVALSSIIGIFVGLSNLTQGSLDIGSMLGIADYVLLALVVLSTTLVIVMLIAIVSALAKTTKEAQTYLTPLMIVVMAVGLLGFISTGNQENIAFYFIPIYNSVLCMTDIFSYQIEPVKFIICVISNIIYTGIGVFVLQKMFNSERLMFAR